MSKYLLPTNATENVTGMYILFKYINNDVSNGYFFLGILLALFVIIFIALKDYKASAAFTTASFMIMVFSIMLRALGLIQNKWMYLAIILTAVGVVWLHSDNSSSPL